MKTRINLSTGLFSVLLFSAMIFATSSCTKEEVIDVNTFEKTQQSYTDFFRPFQAEIKKAFPKEVVRAMLKNPTKAYMQLVSPSVNPSIGSGIDWHPFVLITDAEYEISEILNGIQVESEGEGLFTVDGPGSGIAGEMNLQKLFNSGIVSGGTDIATSDILLSFEVSGELPGVKGGSGPLDAVLNLTDSEGTEGNTVIGFAVRSSDLRLEGGPLGSLNSSTGVARNVTMGYLGMFQ